MSTHVVVKIDGEARFEDRAEGCTIEHYYDGHRRITTVRIHQDVSNPT